MRLPFLFVKVVIVSFFLLLFSCENNQENKIKVYRLAKGDNVDSSSVLKHSDPNLNKEQLNNQLPMPKIAKAKITWKTPEEWKELPASGMRYGSFVASGDVDISAIFLEGAVGGDLANVNRWRLQIALPPWSEEELDQNTKVISTHLGLGKVVEFSTVDKQKSVVAALLPYKHGIWFFKMLGKQEFVEPQKGPFTTFLSSVTPKS